MLQSDKCSITNKNKSLTLFIIGNIITILLKNPNAIIVLHRLTLLVLLILTLYPSVTTNSRIRTKDSALQNLPVAIYKKHGANKKSGVKYLKGSLKLFHM